LLPEQSSELERYKREQDPALGRRKVEQRSTEQRNAGAVMEGGLISE